MAELMALSPCAGLLPISHGAVTLSEVEPGVITSLAPFKGQAEALSEALMAAHGMAFPKPGLSTGKAGARCVWSGRRQAMLLGPAPDAGLARFAAMTDQSDAWAVVSLEGAAATDVLARLVPVDLRAGAFKRGHTARTLLQHMSVSITRTGTRTGAQAFQIMAFRSMAASLCHELDVAMGMVAGRSAGA